MANRSEQQAQHPADVTSAPSGPGDDGGGSGDRLTRETGGPHAPVTAADASLATASPASQARHDADLDRADLRPEDRDDDVADWQADATRE